LCPAPGHRVKTWERPRGFFATETFNVQDFVGSLCPNLCRIGHFSTKASTKFATKDAKPALSQQAQVSSGRLVVPKKGNGDSHARFDGITPVLRVEAIYLASGLFFLGKPRELIWINDNVITFGGY